MFAIPLSMSYAKLAGLPAYYGLYSTLAWLLAYPMFGTSRQLAVGPAALMSLLLSAGLPMILESEGLMVMDGKYLEHYAQLLIQCSICTGVVNIGMGLLCLGFVMQFLSHALISGFASGAALLITFSQVKHLLGYNVKSSDHIQKLIIYLIQDILNFNWKTLLVGLCSITFVMLLKYVSQTYPRFKWIHPLGPFMLSSAAITLNIMLGLDKHSIPVAGIIPAGLPAMTGCLFCQICG